MHTVAWSSRDAVKVVAWTALLLVLTHLGIRFLGIGKVELPSLGGLLLLFGMFLIQEAIFFLPMYFGLLKKYRLSFEALGFRWIGWKRLSRWVFTGLGLQIGASMISVFLLQATKIRVPIFGEQVPHLPLFGADTLGLITAVLALNVIAPLVEEIFFRGFLLQSLAARLPGWQASIIAAAIFAGIHFEFQVFGIMFVLSLIINFLFLRTRSLWPCIGFHMVNNSIALILEWMLITGKFHV